jgi:hypothetical protein
MHCALEKEQWVRKNLRQSESLLQYRIVQNGIYIHSNEFSEISQFSFQIEVQKMDPAKQKRVIRLKKTLIYTKLDAVHD